MNPQILTCTSKCQSLGVHVPPNENVCGHAVNGNAVNLKWNMTIALDVTLKKMESISIY